VPDRQSTRRARRSLDERLASATSTPLPSSGWIRAIRTALGMTQQELADRMGIAAQSEFRLEGNERNGTIRLESLRRAADGLDCDLVYLFIPRAGSLEQAVRAQAAKVLDRQRDAVDRSMSLEDQRAPLSAGAREELIDLLAAEYPIWQAPSDQQVRRASAGADGDRARE
jgi:predicted DNA-binding mobile mystery protein A